MRKVRQTPLPRTAQGLRSLAPHQWMRYARETLGVSQHGLARKLNIDQGYLANIETGRGHTPDYVLERAEQVLGLEPGELGREPKQKRGPKPRRG